MEVVVDADDLEKLLYAAGVIKTLDNVIGNMKKDPFWQSAQGGYEGAHIRCNTAMLNARRGGDARFEAPDNADFHEMKNISTIGLRHKMTAPAVVELRKKGLIELGNSFDVVKWCDSGHVESKPLIEVRVRLTPRGERLLSEWMKKERVKKLEHAGAVIENEPEKPKRIG